MRQMERVDLQSISLEPSPVIEAYKAGVDRHAHDDSGPGFGAFRRVSSAGKSAMTAHASPE